REPKPLLAEFLVTGDITDTTPVADLVITADVLTDTGSVEHRVITLPVTVSAAEGAHVEPEVRQEMLLLEAARGRREALELRERGDFEGAARSLRSLSKTLNDAGLDNPEIEAEAEELHSMAATFAANAVSEADQKYMYHRAYNSMTGRRKKDMLIQRKRPKREEEPPSA